MREREMTEKWQIQTKRKTAKINPTISIKGRKCEWIKHFHQKAEIIRMNFIKRNPNHILSTRHTINSMNSVKVKGWRNVYDANIN